MHKYLLAGVMATLSTVAQANLVNGDFAQIDPAAAGADIYNNGEGPPAWLLHLNTAEGATTASVFNDATRAFEGQAYFAFDTPVGAFGANKLDQCVRIDATQSLTFAYRLRIEGVTPSNDQRVRINPKFYADQAGCEADRLEDGSDRRLTGNRDNDDLDIRAAAAGIEPNVWTAVTDSTHGSQAGAMRYEATDYPVGSQFMRFSLRVRDDSGQASLYIDAIELLQGGSNLLVNGGFEHVALFDGDHLAGSSGWRLKRDTATQRAAAGPAGFALGGGHVVYLEDLTGGFGANRLDQCFAINGNQDIRPSILAYTPSPDAGLALRLNVSFFDDADCAGTELDALEIADQDFTLDGEPRNWLPLVAGETRVVADLGGAASALFSVRLRDRSGSGNNPDVFQKIVYLAEASAVAGPASPVFSPAPGSFDTASLAVTITAAPGAQLVVTTDGSDPDLSHAPQASPLTLTLTQTTEIRAASIEDGALSPIRTGTWSRVAGPTPRPTPSTGTGCTVSANPGATDPLLPALLAMALAWIALRRQATRRP